MVCVVEAEVFFGIGAFYRDFHQLADEEVVASIAAHRDASNAAPERAGPRGRCVHKSARDDPADDEPGASLIRSSAAERLPRR